MEIPIKNIKENCCDGDLGNYKFIKMDEEDTNGSTCDKVIECHDKYYLVEEKSVILSFLHNCCKELNVNLDDYKYQSNDIEHLKISEITELIHPINIEIKKRILADSIVNLTNTSAKKASNTTDILNKKFDNKKTANMSVFYLYCSSGHFVDRIIHIWLSRYKKTLFIECKKLKQKLDDKCKNFE
ncbi:MAG: hypothetical protein JJV94_03185 [Sulfurospirillum sp.]|nr:hypothetical protein [Sulfurospirillum sp.]